MQKLLNAWRGYFSGHRLVHGLVDEEPGCGYAEEEKDEQPEDEEGGAAAGGFVRASDAEGIDEGVGEEVEDLHVE